MYGKEKVTKLLQAKCNDNLEFGGQAPCDDWQTDRKSGPCRMMKSAGSLRGMTISHARDIRSVTAGCMHVIATVHSRRCFGRGVHSAQKV